VLLERLVTNLLDNAIRYNVPGGWVQATTGRQADGVYLTVANSGQPIPAGQVSSLFEPFRRLHPRTGTGTGSGLGLSIVQSVIGAHGGQLSAHSQPDGGLKIEIILSAAGPSARSSHIPAGPARAADGRPRGMVGGGPAAAEGTAADLRHPTSLGYRRDGCAASLGHESADSQSDL